MKQRNVKVYPDFIGRLGNNIFQTAAAIGYATRYGVDWGITKGYIEPSFRVNQVDLFMPWLPSHERKHFRRWDQPTFDYHEIPFFEQGIRLVGFFQSEKYFAHCRAEVEAAIRLPIEDGWRDYCAIHVRRGDYLLYNTHFPPVTIEYFKEAIPLMQQRGFEKFLICSDGMEWCEEVFPANFPGVYFEFSKGRSEWQDMAVMASCGANIIANSSFSWLSAWFNEAGIVVSPHHTSWFGPAGGVVRDALARGEAPCRDLIPDGWHQIKFR